MDYVLTPHALAELVRRGLSVEAVHAVMVDPEQRLHVRPGRIVLQSRSVLGAPPRMFLVRVVVDIDRQPPEVVTAYRTSKISRYWKGPA